MQVSKLFTSLVLLLTVPPFLVYPQAQIPSIIYSTTVSTQVNIDPSEIETPPLLNKPHFSYDDMLNFIEELEEGELENKYSPAELEKINYFLATLAKEGVLPNEAEEEYAVEEDVQELLHEDLNYNCLFSFDSEKDYAFTPAILYGQGIEVILCKSWVKKSWKKTKSFVKKHKKAIIIGAAVVAAATIVVCVVAASVAAGAAATGAAGAAGATGANSSSKHKTTPQAESPKKTVENKLPSVQETPLLQSAVNDHIGSFKNLAVEKQLFQDPNPTSNEFSLGETARNLGSCLAHETLDGISQMAVIIPQLNEEIKTIGSQFLPDSLIQDNPISTNSIEKYDNLMAAGHQKIDQAFLTDHADCYNPAFKANDLNNKFDIGILPPPGSFSRGAKIANFRRVIQAGHNNMALAQEFGFSGHDIIQMKKTGILDRTVAVTFENIAQDKTMFDSMVKSKVSENFLKPYRGKYLPEIKVKQLIRKTGIRTFPRPQGIPENYRIKVSNDGAGINYVHPKNNHLSVRVMPGKPYSQYTHQCNPYVIQMKEGKAFDKFGNLVNHKSPEAHIPINEFVYRSK